MKAASFKNVIPPIAVYENVGNPGKASLSALQENIHTQNKLNKTHGGSKSRFRSRKTTIERKRRYYGGKPASLEPASLEPASLEPASLERPTEMVVPQAPTNGASPTGPNTGNSIAAAASETLLNHSVNSQYDSKVEVPLIPKSQSGGRRMPLLKRLERLTRRKKYSKRNKGKTRRNKKQNHKKK
tara:strand:- start:743 stop:1297 length:555 start_codon:yes stop_codon:yes gene_type:complete